MIGRNTVVRYNGYVCLTWELMFIRECTIKLLKYAGYNAFATFIIPLCFSMKWNLRVGSMLACVRPSVPGHISETVHTIIFIFSMLFRYIPALKRCCYGIISCFLLCLHIFPEFHPIAGIWTCECPYNA